MNNFDCNNCEFGKFIAFSRIDSEEIFKCNLNNAYFKPKSGVIVK